MADAYIRPVNVDAPIVTGDFTISASGETKTPKGIIVMMTNHNDTVADGTAANGVTFNIGVSDGVTEAQISIDSEHGQGTTDTARTSSSDSIINQYYNGGQLFEASALTGGSSGPTAGGWVLNVSAEAWGNTRSILAILFFGADMQCYAGIGDMGAQDVAVTQTPGFEIDGGIFAGIHQPFPTTASYATLGMGLCDYDGVTLTQRAISFYTQHSLSVSALFGATSTDSAMMGTTSGSVFGKVEVSNITASQFDLTGKLTDHTAIDNLYMVWNVGDNPHALENIATPTATGVATLSTEDCSNGVFGLQSHATANDTYYEDGNAGAFGVFAADSVAEYSLAVADEDAQLNSDTQSMYDAKILNVPDHAGGTGIVGTVDSLSSTGLDVNYTAVEASANQGFLYSIGSNAAAGIPSGLSLLGVGT